MDLPSMTEAQQQQLHQLQQLLQQHLSSQQQYQHYPSQPYNPSHPQPDPNHHQNFPFYQSDYANHIAYTQPDPNPIQPPGVSLPQETPSSQGGESGATDLVGPEGDSVGLKPAAAVVDFQEQQQQCYGGTDGHSGMGSVPGLGQFLGHGSVYHGHRPVRPEVGWTPNRSGGLGNFGNGAPRTGGSAPHFCGKGRGRGRSGPWCFPPCGESSSSHPEPNAAEGGRFTEEVGISLDNPVEESVRVAPSQTSIPPQRNAAPHRRPTQVVCCELCKVECNTLEILEQHKNGKRHKKNLQRSADKSSAEIQKSFAGSDPEVTLQSETVQASEDYKQNLHENLPPEGFAWCELCRVQCTSLEILERHKSGKRHNKNLERFGQLNTANMRSTGIQNEQRLVPGSDPEVTLQPENVKAGEDYKQNLLEILPTVAVIDENNTETGENNNQVEQPGNPKEEQKFTVEATKPEMNRFDNIKNGKKRKTMKGGRGGKRMKTSDPPRQPIEPPKPKVVIPIMCDLCNVKCETRAVFSSHVSGKKHIAKLKRFEGHQAMYGPTGLQALYPPNPIAQTLLHPQGTGLQALYPKKPIAETLVQYQGPQQGLHDPQG